MTQIEQVQNELAQTEQRLALSMTNAMNQVKSELSASFGEAVNRQSKQFEANFLELKKALMTPKRKNPGKEDNDMSD